ncbi:MAG: DUF4296 domain-containing protein [Rikenellaceae bacterium]
MKRLIYTCLTAVVLLFGGCSSHKIIPDNELALIFHDAFLANSIVTMKGMKMDSINIYEPIFESYGYTTEDVQYTIGNFSRRKSARLGDVVERAIRILELEGGVYDAQVAVLDTIRSVSQRMSRREVISIDEIFVESMRDTSKLWLRLRDVEMGNYQISFDYLIDSLDENTGNYRNAFWFEGVDEMGSDMGQAERSVTYLQRGGVKSFKKNLEIDIEYDDMVMHVVDIMDKKGEPHFKIRDLKIEYTPMAEVAEELLFEKLVNINIFSDELLQIPTPQDSL